MLKRFTSVFTGKTPKNLGNNLNNTKKSKNSKGKISKKTKSRKSSVLFLNNTTQKYKPISKNKVFNKEEFQELYGSSQPRFKKVLKANVILMYDTDAPNGEGEKNNKTYVHYLEVDNQEVISYQAPSPYRGVHNYYSVSIRCDDDETLKTLKNLNPNERKPDVLQKLHKEKKIDKFEIQGPHVMRMSKFKISAGVSKNNKSSNQNKSSNKNKSKNNNKSKTNRNTSSNNRSESNNSTGSNVGNSSSP